MANFLDRLLARSVEVQRADQGYAEWMYSGAYPVQTMDSQGKSGESVHAGVVRAAREAYKSNGIVFGCQAARAALFSEARFKIQRLSDGGLFGAPGLALLERPWPNATSGELLGRMSIGDTTAGQAFIRLVEGPGAPPFLLEMRPDTVMIVSEIRRDADDRPYKVPVGYLQDVRALGIDADPQPFDTDEVAHFSPNPDPDAMWKGMSWLTPIMREFQVDQALTNHKVRYLEHGALPGLVVKSPRKLSDKAIKTLATRINARHGGPSNTGRTLVLDEGVDAIVAGHSLEQIQADLVAKAGERRIAADAGVPLVVLGLEQGDYQAAVRRMADMWARPMWRQACAVLEHLIDGVPPGCRLWYDVAGIAALREGELARGQTTLVKVQAVAAAVTAGFSRESSVIAAESGDVTLLQADPDAPTPGSTATSATTTSTSTSETVGAPGGPGGGALNGRRPQAALTQTTSGPNQPHLPASRPNRQGTMPRTPLPSRAPGVRRGTIYPDGSVIYRDERDEFLEWEGPQGDPFDGAAQVYRAEWDEVARLAGHHVPGEPYRFRHGWVPVAPYYKTPGDLQAGDVVNFRGAKHMVLPAIPGQESSRSRVFLHRLAFSQKPSSSFLHPQHEAEARPHQHGGLVTMAQPTPPPPAKREFLPSVTVGPTQAIKALGPNAPLGFGGVGARPPRVRGRIEPPPVNVNPEGIKTGDRVRHKMWPSEGGHVRAVDEDGGILQLDNGFEGKIDNFTKLPPPPMAPKAGDSVRPRAGGPRDRVIETTGVGDNRKLRLIGSTQWHDAKDFEVVKAVGPETHQAAHLGAGHHIVTPPGEQKVKVGDWIESPSGDRRVVLDMRLDVRNNWQYRVSVLGWVDASGWRKLESPGSNTKRILGDMGVPGFTSEAPNQPSLVAKLPEPGDRVIQPGSDIPRLVMSVTDRGGRRRVRLAGESQWRNAEGLTVLPGSPFSDRGPHGHMADLMHPSEVTPGAPVLGLQSALQQAAAQNFLHDAGGLRWRESVAGIGNDVGPVNAEQVMAAVPPKLGEPAADYYRRLMVENIQKHGWEWGTGSAPWRHSTAGPPGPEPGGIDKRIGMAVVTPGGEQGNVIGVDASGMIAVKYPTGDVVHFAPSSLEWQGTGVTPPRGSVQRPNVHPEHLEPEGEPERVMVVGHVLVPEQTKLAEAVESGVTSEKSGDSGVQGETRFWTMANGERAVHKTLFEWSDYATAERCASAEYLSAQVAWAIGETNAPPIIRGGSDAEIIKGFVDGQRASDVFEQPPMRPGAKNWRNVSHIGVLDYLVANNDQHQHNYFVMPNGEFSPIDNSSTFGIHGSMRTSPFLQALADAVNSGQTPISMRELDQIELRLKGLRGAFDEADEGVWLDQVLNRLADLRRYEQQQSFPDGAINPRNLTDEGWVAATSGGAGGAAGPGGLTGKAAADSWGFF